ncbi:hypothetical protein SISNIDRAFT_535483 [Sistotremastrum niveocremeum HHB9708]|uniref:Uncharacterized protein n=1 Tax=Sistotremastrum niveocremeum HHB9708 TaxID=1314777 RepID=A0A164NC58_9AGAM|nr:hypothetical protein SISNIDRAFT_535483 [Sistotremastrum niveocremeum HHB9708]
MCSTVYRNEESCGKDRIERGRTEVFLETSWHRRSKIGLIQSFGGTGTIASVEERSRSKFLGAIYKTDQTGGSPIKTIRSNPPFTVESFVLKRHHTGVFHDSSGYKYPKLKYKIVQSSTSTIIWAVPSHIPVIGGITNPDTHYRHTSAPSDNSLHLIKQRKTQPMLREKTPPKDEIRYVDRNGRVDLSMISQEAKRRKGNGHGIDPERIPSLRIFDRRSNPTQPRLKTRLEPKQNDDQENTCLFLDQIEVIETRVRWLDILDHKEVLPRFSDVLIAYSRRRNMTASNPNLAHLYNSQSEKDRRKE